MASNAHMLVIKIRYNLFSIYNNGRDPLYQQSLTCQGEVALKVMNVLDPTKHGDCEAMAWRINGLRNILGCSKDVEDFCINLERNLTSTSNRKEKVYEWEYFPGPTLPPGPKEHPKSTLKSATLSKDEISGDFLIRHVSEMQCSSGDEAWEHLKHSKLNKQVTLYFAE